MAVTVWVCKICGEAYISTTDKPARCPFCGAYEKYLIDSKEYDDTGDWDIELNETDKANAEKALGVEISNTLFYKCSAKKVEEIDGKKLFKILGKVESEHAAVWKKILKLKEIKWEPAETCEVDYKADLEDSHSREERAIKFYGEAAAAAENPRVKEIFEAFVQVETDHLKLSEERLK
ncbi:MAG: ferritin family protein [Candidatus Hodarchaeales archaeon]|jgi:rubrerythrin